MRKNSTSFPQSVAKRTTGIQVVDIERHARAWLLDCEVRQLSSRTIESRHLVMSKLVWHLHQTEAAACGATEIRAFLAYLNRGHEDEYGRWGNADHPSARAKGVSGNVAMYVSWLGTFFRCLVEEGVIHRTPPQSGAAIRSAITPSCCSCWIPASTRRI